MIHSSAIFDMDGTLVDSMGYWRNLATDYLHSRGVRHIPPEILEKIKPMTMLESSALFIESFGFDATPEQVRDEMNETMNRHYREDILLKDGIGLFLDALKKRNTRMCVASATPEDLVRICLDRLGILDCFDFIISCERVGRGKDFPDIYFECARLLGSEPDTTDVYEDALFAARTAKKAGFYVIGVYDTHSAYHWDELCKCSDIQIRDFHHWEEIL